jgi:hypothetical protein
MNDMEQIEEPEEWSPLWLNRVSDSGEAERSFVRGARYLKDDTAIKRSHLADVGGVALCVFRAVFLAAQADLATASTTETPLSKDTVSPPEDQAPADQAQRIHSFQQAARRAELLAINSFDRQLARAAEKKLLSNLLCFVAQSDKSHKKDAYSRKRLLRACGMAEVSLVGHLMAKPFYDNWVMDFARVGQKDVVVMLYGARSSSVRHAQRRATSVYFLRGGHVVNYDDIKRLPSSGVAHGENWRPILRAVYLSSLDGRNDGQNELVSRFSALSMPVVEGVADSRYTEPFDIYFTSSDLLVSTGGFWGKRSCLRKGSSNSERETQRTLQEVSMLSLFVKIAAALHPESATGYAIS